MVFIVTIQSFSDIITNSSSELFVTSSDNNQFTASFIEKILEKIWQDDRIEEDKIWKLYNEGKITWEERNKMLVDKCIDHSSGDGARLDIKTASWKDVVWYIRKCDRYKYDKKHGHFLEIIVDHNRVHSIKWIKENLQVISSCCW